MSYKYNNILKRLFRNDKGAIVIWQNPNIPLWIWIISTALTFLFKSGYLHTGFQSLGKLALFTWAYLEIRSGESIFRRILGAAVLVSIIYDVFTA